MMADMEPPSSSGFRPSPQQKRGGRLSHTLPSFLCDGQDHESLSRFSHGIRHGRNERHQVCSVRTKRRSRRPDLMDKVTFEERKSSSRPDARSPRDSAHKHVTGTADYIDDLPEPAGTLHGGLGLSDRAHAEIVRHRSVGGRGNSRRRLGDLHRQGRARRQRCQPDGSHDEPLLAETRSSSTASRSSPSSPKPATSPAGPPQGQDRVSRPAALDRYRRRARKRRPLSSRR
jgi:hypothetical protein